MLTPRTRSIRRLVLPVLAAAFLWPATAARGQDEPPPVRSSAPSWDARGLGPLPWQGVSCLDLDEKGRWLAVGTIAPPGDPNVFLLDAEGRLVRAARAGQRWLQQVAVDQAGKRLYALCTMPERRAGDFPTVYACGEQPVAVPPQLGENGWPQNLFHYGDHSNHTGVILRGLSDGAVVVYGDRVLWLRNGDEQPDAQVEFSRPEDGVTVSLAAAAGGDVLVGCTARRPGGGPTDDNLFLLSPQSRKPLWARPAVVETAAAAPPEKGLYGTPALPDGTHTELPQEDRAVFAPLSTALDGDGDARRIAAADYPAWQRRVRSSATLHEQNYGTRFVPARPTVSVYDGRGKLLRRFGPDVFPRPAWLDLAFFDHGKYLLAYPHSWTCRGLAGQSTLPADDEAHTLFVLDVETGKVHTLECPDAISDVSVSAAGRAAVGCWDGKVYRLDEDRLLRGELPEGVIGHRAIWPESVVSAIVSVDMDTPRELSPDVLAALPSAVVAFLQWQTEQIGLLTARVAELEAKLGKDSSNSSLPPSTAHPHAKPPRPKRLPRRSPGGQPGHAKHERALIPVQQCQAVVTCLPTACRRCGEPLAGADPEPLRHQVWELPEILPVVTEYQRHRLVCVCGCSTCADLPAGVPTGQAGPRLIAFSGLLMACFRQSKRRAAPFLSMILNQPASSGWMVVLQKRAAEAVQLAYDELAQQLPAQPALHIDESPTKEGQAKAWVWTFVAAAFTFFSCRTSRAADVATQLLGAAFGGVVHCDRTRMYWAFGRLQWRLAHLKRDFQALIDSPCPTTRRLGWDLRRPTKEMFALWKKVRDGTLSRRQFQRQMHPIRVRVEGLLLRGYFQARLYGFCKELWEHRERLWVFVDVEGIEPTHNAAEQALRHAVIWRKWSFGTQSASGSRFVERMLTVIETCRRQNRNVYAWLTDAVQARIAGQPAPSLLPGA